MLRRTHDGTAPDGDQVMRGIATVVAKRVRAGGGPNVLTLVANAPGALPDREPASLAEVIPPGIRKIAGLRRRPRRLGLALAIELRIGVGRRFRKRETHG